MSEPYIYRILKQLEERNSEDFWIKAYEQLTSDEERLNFVSCAVEELKDEFSDNESTISDLEADNTELKALIEQLKAENKRLKIKLGILPVPG